jgi:hypothetical protein
VRRTRLLVVAAIVAVLLAVFGAIAALTRDSTKHTFVLPRCALPKHAIEPPPPFPRAFPLPKGTVYSTVTRYPTQIVVAGRVPMGLLPAVRFLVREVPRKGFRLGQGESEPGFEAESGFTGHGIVGRFTVRVLPRCRGAALFLVAVARAAKSGATTTTPVVGGMPACAGAGGGVASGLPPSFPLPAGTVVRTSHKQTIGARPFVLVLALAPGTIADAVRFILHRLPKAGYALPQADQEATEAEAAFVGHGVRGRIRFHTLVACDGALTIDIAAHPR